MLCGIFTTLLVPETKSKTLEQLAGEKSWPRLYGEEGRREAATLDMKSTHGNKDLLVRPLSTKHPDRNEELRLAEMYSQWWD